MSPLFKSLFAWLAIVAFVGLIAYMVVEATSRGEKLPYSDFLDRVERGEVASVMIRGNDVLGELKAPAAGAATAPAAGTAAAPVRPARFSTFAPQGEGVIDSLVAILRAKGVKIESERERGPILGQLVWLIPIAVMVIITIVLMRQMQGTGAKAMSFGKSRARLLSSNQKKVTFKDVAGCDEAKEELREIIDFLKDPQKFVKLGGKIPKGVLLVGHPGTGKTLLARAVAGEANVPFFSLSGSDFVEMFVGVGASRVRDLFEQGKKNAPCIIFIDEIDAVGRHRGAGLGGGHDEREQTLNALLVEMDGFETNEGVIIIAATNRPDVLDPALLRPGRFDRRVVVGLPDVRGRLEILKVHVRKVPLEEGVNLDIVARSTPGFSGADLANLVNEAALLAARANKKSVGQLEFDLARDKIVMGAARKSLILSDREKRVTAFHEAGHALTAALLTHAMPVHKVTIIPRAMALGVTQFLPEDDRHSHSARELKAQLAVSMGGRAAEHLVFSEYTTGAADDIKKATDIARRMVAQWGMSERIGPLGFAERDGEVFLGRDISRAAEYSDQTAQEIDQEVRLLVQEAWDTSVRLLTESRDKLDRIALALLERETISAEDLKLVLENKELPPLPALPSSTPPPPISSGTEGTGTAIPVSDAPQPAPLRPRLDPLADGRSSEAPRT